MTIAAGSVLENRYRIEQLLGQGGMGAVYRAYDTRLQQAVAIKENTVARPDISQEAIQASRRQFEQEALILARLRHPNLPRVSDHFVTDDGNQYLVMDFVEGQDLGQAIASQRTVPEAQAIAWIGQVCDALEYLHNQQPPIIHRDVKPQNIRVTSKGQVFLVDFGIAKMDEASGQTMAGALSVTPGFSPPEQYAREGTDARTDIYSLGATLYALLTGQIPPDSISLQSGDKHLVPPREMNAAISPHVQETVLKAMSPRRPDRPQSVAEFWCLLSIGTERRETVALPSGPPVSREVPAVPAEAQARSARKPWVLVLAGVGVLALILVVVVALTSRSNQLAQAPVTSITRLQPTQVAASPVAQPTEMRPTETRLVETSAPATVAGTALPTDLPQAVPNPPRTAEQVDAIDLTGKNVAVTFWHEQSQRNQSLLQAMLDEFNRTNKYGITAQAEIAGTTYGDLYRKVNAAALTGASPEISIAYQNQTAVYRAAGTVVDLTPFMQSKKYGLSQSDLSDLYPVMLQGDVNPFYPGEQLGLPMQRAMQVLYYNSDWLRLLGYSAPPRNWQEFEEIACKAVDKSKKKTGWAFQHDATVFEALVLGRGGRILSEDGTAYVFNGDAGIDALKMIQRMFEKDCAVEVPTSERFGEETRFGNGEALFVLASSEAISFYADAVNKGARFKWDIALPPNSGTPVVNLYGPSLSIHKTTPEHELAAWLAIRFLSEQEQTARWSIQTGYLPVRKSARGDTLTGMRADKYYGPVTDRFAKLFDWVQYSIFQPPVAGYDDVRLLMDRNVMSKVVAAPQADAQALLDAAVNRANDTLK